MEVHGPRTKFPWKLEFTGWPKLSLKTCRTLRVLIKYRKNSLYLMIFWRSQFQIGKPFLALFFFLSFFWVKSIRTRHLMFLRSLPSRITYIILCECEYLLDQEIWTDQVWTLSALYCRTKKVDPFTSRLLEIHSKMLKINKKEVQFDHAYIFNFRNACTAFVSSLYIDISFQLL